MFIKQSSGINEHNPVFSYTTAQATFSVSEDSAIGYGITSFTATDADYAPHSIVKYSIVSGNRKNNRTFFLFESIQIFNNINNVLQLIFRVELINFK